MEQSMTKDEIIRQIKMQRLERLKKKMNGNESKENEQEPLNFEHGMFIPEDDKPIRLEKYYE